MTYDPTLPNIEDGYSTAQPEILENFSQADTVFDVDHVGFSSTTDDGGNHDTVRLLEQVSVPSTDVDEMALFCVNDATVGVTACFRNEDDGAVICVSPASSTGFSPVAQAAVLFNSAGVIAGSALNVSSVSVSGTSPVQYTVNFTAPIPADCIGQVSFNFSTGPNVVPPSVYSVGTTTAVIYWLGPLSSATFSQMSFIVWNIL